MNHEDIQGSAARLLQNDSDVLDETRELLYAISKDELSRNALHSASGPNSYEVLHSLFAGGRVESDVRLDYAQAGKTSIEALGFNSGRLPKNRERLDSIIRLVGRPSLLIKEGVWESPSIATLKKRLKPEILQSKLASIGRIEIRNSGDVSVLGTGWMIKAGLLITNRHVATNFCAMNTQGGNPVLNLINDEVANVDWNGEFGSGQETLCEITGVEHIEPASSPYDIALLSIREMDGGLPSPLEIEASEPSIGMNVVTIGYPSDEDSQTDRYVIDEYFDGIFGVKRLSPGKLTGIDDSFIIAHDCTTLPGSSGSAVLNSDTGKVVGIHFRGAYRKENSAVSSIQIGRIL